MNAASKLKNKLKRIARKFRFKGSADFWKSRYAQGGNSGYGSYGRLAEFKADILNRFVKNMDIGSIIEFGCGDGNQLKLASYPAYTGYDISPAAVEMCRSAFRGDQTKQFFALDDYDGRKADLSMSLDVIFHLVEDAVFEAHMRTVFGASSRYVIVYASNTDDNSNNYFPHVRHRKFTDFVGAHLKDWELVETIPNPYPYKQGTKEGSYADFHIFKRVGSDQPTAP